MEWYYSDGRQQFGPISDDQLSALEINGTIGQQTLVWRSGMGEWAPLASAPRLGFGVTAGVTEPAAAVGDALPARPEAVPASPGGVATSSAAPPKFCSQCGQPRSEAEMVAIGGAQVCYGCRDTYLQRMRAGTVAAATPQTWIYGGFWIRVLAEIIDAILTSILQMVVLVPLMFGAGAASSEPNGGIIALTYLLSILVVGGYHTAFLVYKGATPGKMVVSLQVVRTDGKPITWPLAIGRYFAKMLSALIFCIGYIMVAFDVERRSLHDRICNTRVVKRI